MITRIVLVLTACGVVGALAGCGAGQPSGSDDGDITIVVTTPVLGSLVRELAGNAAHVEVLMRDGVDPHEWQPSAKAIEAVGKAELVVANGLGLEEGLEDALEEAEAAGGRVFRAADHVDVRTIGGGDVDHPEGGEHAHDGGDPHVWTDPVAMQAVLADLALLLDRELGLSVAERAARLERRLGELHAEIEDTVAVLPAAVRRLATGHESLGYFADRYGFELVGALIPSLNPQAEASAGELADLKDRIETEGVDVLFTESGARADLARAVAAEAGADVVELPSHTLPGDGSYFTLMRTIAEGITGALAP